MFVVSFVSFCWYFEVLLGALIVSEVSFECFGCVWVCGNCVLDIFGHICGSSYMSKCTHT